MSKLKSDRRSMHAIDYVILPYISKEEIRPEPKIGCWTLKTWDCISAGLSLVCLVVISSFALGGEGKHNVDINREMLMYSNKTAIIQHMRFMQRGYQDYCSSVKPKYVQADWQQNNETGLVVASPVSMHATSIELWGFAIWIFFWSFIFQGLRGNVFGGENWYYPEKGPEFSRWLEYVFTSPAQIFIVNVAFGVGNLDTLLGAMGMQAALVLLGYDIEHQIKKIYKHVEKGAKEREQKRFQHIFPFIRDLRLWIYLGITWILHTLIWGMPLLTRMGASCPWGIDGRFQLQQYHNKKCGEKLNIPWYVDFIFWTQYLLFSIFGFTCTWQVFRAKYVFKHKVNGTTFLWKTYNKGYTSEQSWQKYSAFYSFLSITAKTLLEVGFLLLVLNFQNWKELEAPTFTCSNHTGSSCLLLSEWSYKPVPT